MLSVENLEINITAYKYESYPNSLIDQIRQTDALEKVFIRVWDNSPEELIICGADDIRHNSFNPSLSRVWNWAVGSCRKQHLIIANDDIKLSKDWFYRLNCEVTEYSNSLWFGPSRFFLFDRRLVKKVGWFDESFCGFTYEDLDYVRRMNHHRVEHKYGSLSSLSRNAMSLKERIVRPCHPYNNVEYFTKKYKNINQECFEDEPLFETPNYYPEAT